MNKTQAGYLKKLADGLANVPPEKFNMEFWGQGKLQVEEPEFTCNYAGCAVGWAPKLVPECGLTLEISRGYADVLIPLFRRVDGLTGEPVTLRGYQAVADCFGLTLREVESLFDPQSYLPRASPVITTDRVAKRILRFLAENPVSPEGEQ